MISLPQACPQSWDAMTPTSGGRHCEACQQVVVDFTAYTDAELAAYLGRPGKLPCGRFRESQLGRVLHPAAAPVVGWRRWLAAVVALLGVGSLATPARAQSSPAHPAVAPVQATPAQRLGRPALPQRPVVRPVRPVPTVARPPEQVLGGTPVAVPLPPEGQPKK